MRRTWILTFIVLLTAFASIPALAQTGLQGHWEWRSPMDKDKRQTIFGISIFPKKGKVSGTYFFNDLTDGETESDGAVSGYIGTVTGTTMTIEFDPDAADPGYTENVRYKKPKGRSPSTARLVLKNGVIEWTQTGGKLGDDMPKTFVLRRSK
jgi:hypothetical protein